MTQTILIPLDGSELAERILMPVGKLLEADAELHLLRVVEPGASTDDAHTELDVLAQRLQGEGVDCHYRIVSGDPAEEILEAVAALKVTLVAMSTHGRTGLARLFRGSVAERVLRHCAAPLLLCNPHALDADAVTPGFPTILVPLDGSVRSAAILGWVADLAKTYGSKVVLMRVEPFIPAAVPSPIVHSETWDPGAVERTLHPFRDELVEAGVEVELKVSMGIEPAEILDAAHHADLVALSSHGRSGLSRWWFGSVAEQVLRHCDRPLLVVRAQDD